MADNQTDTRTADEIERDIRATQQEMSRTVDQLENQFTPRNLLNAALDKADGSGIDSRYLLDCARRNPLALGMIAVGGLWLVSDADARPSALKPSWGGSGKDGDDHATHGDDYHRSYIAHMAACEPRHDEDEISYRRRRDAARGSYLMLEQHHDEDESSYRQRLNDATDRMRERRDHLSEQARAAGQSAREGAGRAAGAARGAYQDNPLLGGFAAAFVGAIAGSLLPVSRTEEDYLGGAGERVLDEAQARARQAGDIAREKKDELVEAADSRMSQGSGSPDNSESVGYART